MPINYGEGKHRYLPRVETEKVTVQNHFTGTYETVVRTTGSRACNVCKMRRPLNDYFLCFDCQLLEDNAR